MAGVGSTAAAQNQAAASTPPAGTGTGLAGSQTPLNLGSSNLGYVNPGQYAGWQGNLGNFLNMFNIPQSGQGSGMQALGVNNNTGINVSQPNAGNTFAGFGQYLYPLLGFLSNFLGPTPNTNVNVAGAPNVTPQSGSFANFATSAPVAPVQPASNSGIAQRLDPGVQGTGPSAGPGQVVSGGGASPLSPPPPSPPSPLASSPNQSVSGPGLIGYGGDLRNTNVGGGSATPVVANPGTRTTADLMQALGLI